jgi:hypothetical protein
VIIEVPEVIVVTVPEVLPIVPTAALLLLHVPPEVASLKVLTSPRHRIVVPVIEAGAVFTVTTMVEMQPELMW